MEKGSKTSQTQKSTRRSSQSATQRPITYVGKEIPNSLPIDFKTPGDVQEYYGELRKALHHEIITENTELSNSSSTFSSKLCTWELPPKSKKEDCGPVDCKNNNVE